MTDKQAKAIAEGVKKAGTELGAGIFLGLALLGLATCVGLQNFGGG